MEDDEFEWDDANAAINLATHGVSFDAARQACGDALAAVREDRHRNSGEDRYILIGMSQGSLLCVAYTLRGERIRIIAARLAELHERRRYREEKALPGRIWRRFIS